MHFPNSHWASLVLCLLKGGITYLQGKDFLQGPILSVVLSDVYEIWRFPVKGVHFIVLPPWYSF